MLDKPSFIIDGTCEIFDLLKPLVKDVFYNFSEQKIDTTAIYIIGRIQFAKNKEKIRDLIEKHNVKFVFSNPFEGSSTLTTQLVRHGMDDLIKDKKILIIGGGDMDDSWPYIKYDLFLSKIHEFDENQIECARTEEIYNQLHKPFKFLFLNGRGRPHRRWLLEKLDTGGLLDQSVWTWLDPGPGRSRILDLKINGQDLMDRPRNLQLLDPKYEIKKYNNRLNVPKGTVFAKYDLFNNEWGEIYVRAEPYIDTYFSLVTETIFDYPYSFRTEKIWKPIAMGHPWVVASNKGYIKDMQNLGFKTFNHLYDESFDQIDDNRTRLERVAQTVEDLCNQDLASFLTAAKDTCKYNQQHLLSIREPTKKQFPNQFLKFLQDHQWMT